MGLGDYFSEKSEKDYILQGACPRQPAPQLANQPASPMQPATFQPASQPSLAQPSLQES